jgi:hypothetical protein
MIIEVNKKYNLPCFWSEIPLRKAKDMLLCVNSMPENESSADTCMDWIADMTAVTIDAKPETVKKILPDKLFVFYNKFINNFVYDLKAGASHEIYDKNYFLLDSEKLYIPQPANVMDELLYFTDEKAIVYSEIADQIDFSSNYLNNFEKIIAICCRKKNEIYSESIVLQRYKALEDIRMDIVWRIFFWLHRLGYLFDRRSLIYSERTKLENLN